MATGSLKRPRLSSALAAALRFARSQRGSVAVVFGLAFPVVAMASFYAVDYSRASMAKQTMQEALDAASLIAARSTATTNDQIDAIGDAAFAAQIPAGSPLQGVGLDGTGRNANVTFSLSTTKVEASATATLTPVLDVAFLSPPVLTVHATSEVVRSINNLEIAMVLDTTGSMQGTKIANLITAAKNFVTTMQTAATRASTTNPVKISIVPFSTTVKVMSPLSMATYNTATFSMTGLPTWLDGRARSTPWNFDIFTNANSGSTRVDRFALLKTMAQSWGGCVEARAAPYDIRETAPTTSDVNTLFTPFFWPDEPDTNSAYLNDYLNDVSASNTWSIRQGYAPKYNTSTFKVSGTFIPSAGYGAPWAYGPNAACNMQGLMRLTTDFDGLRSQIDGLVASGETNIPLGLMWGWHTLSPNAPFADGVSYDTPNTTKIIVLMTDGENTMDAVGAGNLNASLYHGYGYIWQNKLGTVSSSQSTRTSAIDSRMVSNNESLCGNIKAKNIQIYTVGVGVTSASKTLLQTCATTTGNYYDVDSQASNLNAAFDAIAGSIQNLRISK